MYILWCYLPCRLTDFSVNNATKYNIWYAIWNACNNNKGNDDQTIFHTRWLYKCDRRTIRKSRMQNLHFRGWTTQISTKCVDYSEESHRPRTHWLNGARRSSGHPRPPTDSWSAVEKRFLMGRLERRGAAKPVWRWLGLSIGVSVVLGSISLAGTVSRDITTRNKVKCAILLLEFRRGAHLPS